MSDTHWPYFPIFLKLTGERVLVVGGGEVALRKVRLLQRAQARIEIVACELHPELTGLVASAAEFDESQLDGCRLAIAATDDAALNARVASAARTWITPSIVDRAPVLVAISSGGAAPVPSLRLREQVEALLPAALGRVAAFLGAMRGRLKDVP
ncbi:MAG: precorrin-2 dehydrogenase/sirohydrochlorin ferrochelatase family protein, partial [Gammaproteobacteria bacterium]